MKSILQMYKIGKGPTTTQNMAAYRACKKIAQELKPGEVDAIEVRLYNEFARLDSQLKSSQDILDAFKNWSKVPVKVVTNFPTPPAARHPLTFDVILIKNKEYVGKHRVVSTGCGNFFITDQLEATAKSRYHFESFEEMKEYFLKNKISYLDFCAKAQSKEEITAHFDKCLALMDKVIDDGLKSSGLLKLTDARIKYERRAKHIFETKLPKENDDQEMIRLISAYAYAIGEEAASRAEVVVSPSCGTTATTWAAIKWVKDKFKPSKEKLYNAMCIAGLIASLIDQNASINANEAGCQAELSTACGMASVIAAYVMYDAKIDELGRVWEMAIEHCLGITCCAVCALPLVPCIQRAAAFAVRAIENAVLNHVLMGSEELCKLDDVIKVMYETGKDLAVAHKSADFEGFAAYAKYSLS